MLAHRSDLSGAATPHQVQTCVYLRCLVSVSMVIAACVHVGALDAEIRDQQIGGLQRAGGFSVYLAWPKSAVYSQFVLIGAFVFSACLLPAHPCRKQFLLIEFVCTLALLYGPLVQKTMGQTGIAEPGRLVLTWDEFASRHGCAIEHEPAITRSIAIYREKCAGRITVGNILESVSRTGSQLIGISISNSHAQGDRAVRSSKVVMFGNDDSKKRVFTRWDWLVKDLRALAMQVRLPTVTFPVWLHDGFNGGVEACFPIFVQEKAVTSLGGVLAPPRSATGIFDWEERGADYDKNVKSAMRANAIPFKSKKNKAFFRGSTTGGIFSRVNWRQYQRSKVVQLSLKRPDLLDARFTAGVQIESGVWEEMVSNNFTGPFINQHADSSNYKMVIVPDGNSVPDRLMSLLVSDVVVLKPRSTQHEYWYDELVPGLHFIPFQQDVSDLEKVIVEALTNVSHLEYIAGQAKRFVLRRLNPSSIACYWGLLLREYSTLFNHTDLGQGSSPLLQ